MNNFFIRPLRDRTLRTCRILYFSAPRETERFSTGERPRLTAALYLLTHISVRDPQFSFHLCLYLPAIPPVLFYLEISNDPPDTSVLSRSSAGTFVSVARSGCCCTDRPHVARAKIRARPLA